jgi:hypothetical protein
MLSRYSDRCYRYVAADVGHIVENVRLVALALGLRCSVEPMFDDAQVHKPPLSSTFSTIYPLFFSATKRPPLSSASTA